MTLQNSIDSSTAWAAVGESAAYEDCLIGNREGLTQLRDALTEAITSGESQIPPNITSICRIVVVESTVNPEYLPKKRVWKDAFALISCGIVVFAFGLLVIFGLMFLFKK